MIGFQNSSPNITHVWRQFFILYAFIFIIVVAMDICCVLYRRCCEVPISGILENLVSSSVAFYFVDESFSNIYRTWLSYT